MYQEPEKHIYSVISGQEFIEILQALSVILKGLNDFARYERRKQSEKLKEEWKDGAYVMDLLNIKRGTLQNLRDKRILPFTQVGGKILYKVSDIEKLLESNYTRRSVNQN